MAVVGSFGLTGALNLTPGVQLDDDNDWTNLNYFSKPVTISDPTDDTCVLNAEFLNRGVQDPTAGGLPYNSCVSKAGTQTLTGHNTFGGSPNCRNPVNTVDALNSGTLNAQLAQFAGVELDVVNTFTGVNTFPDVTANSYEGPQCNATNMLDTFLTAPTFSAENTTIDANSTTSAVYFAAQGAYPKQMLLGYASNPNPGQAYQPNGRFVYLDRSNTSTPWPIPINKSTERPYYQTWYVTGTATAQGSIVFPQPESLDPVGQIVQIWNGLLAGKSLLIYGDGLRFYTKNPSTNAWVNNSIITLVSGFCTTLIYGGNNIWYSMFDD
jgi:hypothetical protein